MVLRREDAIFFVFDNDRVKEESDFPADGILYFSPSAIEKSEQSGLVGQLIGVNRFLQATFGSQASVFCLQDIKIATRHVEHYTLGLSGKVHCSSVHLCELLERLLGLFQFYQGGFGTLEKMCQATGKDFYDELTKSWDCFTAFIKRYGDSTSSDFQSVPYLKPSKDIESEVCIQSARLLDDIGNMVPGVKAGCLLYDNQACYTQMTPVMTSRLLIIRPKQHNLPCQQLPTDLELQGIRIFKVYLTPGEIQSISSGHRNQDTGPGNFNFGANALPTDLSSDSSELSQATAHSEGPRTSESDLEKSIQTVVLSNDITHSHVSTVDEVSATGGDGLIDDRHLVNGGKEPSCDRAVEMEMFIQGSSDSVCVLLMENGAIQDVTVLKKVWKHILLCISDIERLIRSSGSPLSDIKQKQSPSLFHYLMYNSATGNLSGDLWQPVTSPEHDFCRAAQMMHEEFKDNADTREIIFRTHQSVFTGIQDGYEELFSWSTGFPPNHGLPSSESDPDTDQLIMKLKEIKLKYS